MDFEFVPGWSTCDLYRKTNIKLPIFIFRLSASERAIFRYASSKWSQNALQNELRMTLKTTSEIESEVSVG